MAIDLKTVSELSSLDNSDIIFVRHMSSDTLVGITKTNLLSALASGAETALYSSNYTTAALLIAAIGTGADKKVILNSNLAISSATVFPKNAHIVWSTGGKFTQSGTGSLTILCGLTIPRTKVFFGFSTTADTFGILRSNLLLNGATEAIYPEWFGAVCDDNISTKSGTDDYAALQLMLDSIHIDIAGYRHSGRFVFGNGKFSYSSQSLIVRRSCHITGTGGAGIFSSSGVRFPADKKGFIYHTNISELGIDVGFTAHESKIERMRIQGDVLNATHTITTSGLNLTKVTGNAINTTEYPIGTVFLIQNTPFLLAAPASSATAATFRPARFQTPSATGNTINATNCLISGAWWVDGTVKRNGDATVYTITAVNSGAQTISVTPSMAGAYEGDIEFTPPNQATAVPAFFSIYHGIDAKVRVSIESCCISSFAGNGIHDDSSTIPNDGGGEPSNNYTRVRENRIEYSRGHGVYSKGLNSNAGLFEINDSSGSRGYGYYDTSFLGNNYLCNHAASSQTGHYFSVGGTVNRSFFSGNYGETQSPTSFIGMSSMWIGGNNASGWHPSTEGILILTTDGLPNALSFNAQLNLTRDIIVASNVKGLIQQSRETATGKRLVLHDNGTVTCETV